MIAGVLGRATRACTTPLLPADHPAFADLLRSVRSPRGRIVATRPVGPSTAELLTVSATAVPDGSVSTRLARGTRPGDLVGPGPAAGAVRTGVPATAGDGTGDQ